jgi:hypothetical protein
MKKSLADRINVCFLLLAALWLFASILPACAAPVDWQILPFPQDSDWGGYKGQPATTNGNVVTFYGRPVRSVQFFSGALHISYDVVLQAQNASDGAFQIAFVPTGLPTNTAHSIYTQLRMEYGPGDLVVGTNGAATYLWKYTPFNLNSQTVYHCEVDLSASGGLTWTINNLTNSIPSTIKVPYSSYQLDLLGWQPDNIWRVSNFDVVPEPATAILATVGVGLLLSVSRRRKSR